MTRAVFLLESLTNEKVDTAKSLGADTLFVGYQNISEEMLLRAKKAGLGVNLEVGLFIGEDLLKKYPDCRPVNKKGEVMETVHWYGGVCPNHPSVQEERLETIKSLTQKYDIGGIWLDFIRYPCHWEEVRSADIEEYCFCHNCRQGFEDSGRGDWIGWRCQQITDFAKDVRSLLPSDIQLGLFAVPWRQNDYDGAIKRIMGQDFDALAQYVDVFSPMTYHRFTENQTSWIGDVVQELSTKTHKPILPLVQTEDRAGKISAEEFKESIEQTLRNPSDGMIVFFLEDLLKDPAKIAVLKQI